MNIWLAQAGARAEAHADPSSRGIKANIHRRDTAEILD
jgi:hypothetical protein